LEGFGKGEICVGYDSGKQDSRPGSCLNPGRVMVHAGLDAQVRSCLGAAREESNWAAVGVLALGHEKWSHGPGKGKMRRKAGPVAGWN
jgi:hypothetical protein